MKGLSPTEINQVASTAFRLAQQRNNGVADISAKEGKKQAETYRLRDISTELTDHDLDDIFFEEKFRLDLFRSPKKQKATISVKPGDPEAWATESSPVFGKSDRPHILFQAEKKIDSPTWLSNGEKLEPELAGYLDELFKSNPSENAISLDNPPRSLGKQEEAMLVELIKIFKKIAKDTTDSVGVWRDINNSLDQWLKAHKDNKESAKYINQANDEIKLPKACHRIPRAKDTLVEFLLDVYKLNSSNRDNYLEIREELTSNLANGILGADEGANSYVSNKHKNGLQVKIQQEQLA